MTDQNAIPPPSAPPGRGAGKHVTIPAKKAAVDIMRWITVPKHRGRRYLREQIQLHIQEAIVEGLVRYFRTQR